MNRTQKKCLIASVATHGLLILLLFVGPAFFSPSDKAQTHTFITMIPLNGVISDAPTSIAGAAPQTPQPAPAPAPAPSPQVQPQPLSIPPRPQPETAVAVPRPQPQQRPAPTPVQKTGDEFTPTKPKTSSPDDFTPVKGPTARTRSNVKPTDTATANAAPDPRLLMVTHLRTGANGLERNLKNDKVVQIGTGGDTGEATINYSDLVYSTYLAAWNPPASLTDESATVLVRITISRSGQVTQHDVLKASGNAAMDQSIQNTLNNVTFVATFPAGSHDLERSYTIKFNISAKKAL